MNRPHACRRLLWLIGLIAVAIPVRADGDDRLPVAFEREADRLLITVGGESLATYVFRDETILRPYFAHVFAPGGIPVTRRFPPVEGTDPTDHATMHPGLWLGFGDINGVDFWRNKGRVEHQRFVEPPQGGPGQGTFVVRNRYVPRSGTTPVCVETGRVTILVRPAGTLMIFDSEFVSEDQDLAFGAQEEMGLGVRVATPLAAKQGGRLRNSTGQSGERQVWGNHAAWCDTSGMINERHAGVLLMPDPSVFARGWFHARDYGLMVANPIERSENPKGEPAKLVIPRGQPVRLRFGVLLHAEQADDDLDLEKAYQDFVRAIATRGETRTP